MSSGRIRIRTIIVVLASGIAVLMATMVAIRAFIFEPLVISGPSMIPTIVQGDRILVSKLAYRFHEPDRGDIIAFKIGWRRLVKRVAGLPGDVIEVRNGLLYRDGKAIIREPQVNVNPRLPRAGRIRSPYHPSRRSRKPRMVRSKHVFVVGDNRDLSVDSRDFGTIPYQDIIGKVVFIYFPPGRLGRLK